MFQLYPASEAEGVTGDGICGTGVLQNPKVKRYDGLMTHSRSSMMVRLVRVPLLTLGCVLLVVTPWGTGAASITGQTATPIVDLGYAKYQGFVDSASKNTHFFGMRYAAPPVGKT
jgi:hypothetical protein